MKDDVGQRNKQITIERRSPDRDAANQPVDTWLDVFGYKLWASYRTSRGMSAVRGGEEGVPATLNRVSWSVAYRPIGIDVGMRVSYQGSYYNIIAIKHDHAEKNWTDLVCEIGGANE